MKQPIRDAKSATAPAQDHFPFLSIKYSALANTITSAKNIRNGITRAVARIVGNTNILKKYPRPPLIEYITPMTIHAELMKIRPPQRVSDDLAVRATMIDDAKITPVSNSPGHSNRPVVFQMFGITAAYCANPLPISGHPLTRDIASGR